MKMIRQNTLYIAVLSVNRYGIKHLILSIDLSVYRKIHLNFYVVTGLMSSGRGRQFVLLLKFGKQQSSFSELVGRASKIVSDFIHVTVS